MVLLKDEALEVRVDFKGFLCFNVVSGLEDGDDAEAVVVGFEVDYHFFFMVVEVVVLDEDSDGADCHY